MVENDYEPFGPEWQKKLMKFKKTELIGLYKVSQLDLQKLENEYERVTDWLWQYREELKSTNVFHKNEAIIRNISKLIK